MTLAEHKAGIVAQLQAKSIEMLVESLAAASLEIEKLKAEAAQSNEPQAQS